MIINRLWVVWILDDIYKNSSQEQKYHEPKTKMHYNSLQGLRTEEFKCHKHIKEIRMSHDVLWLWLIEQ